MRSVHSLFTQRGINRRQQPTSLSLLSSVVLGSARRGGCAKSIWISIPALDTLSFSQVTVIVSRRASPGLIQVVPAGTGTSFQIMRSRPYIRIILRASSACRGRSLSSNEMRWLPKSKHINKTHILNEKRIIVACEVDGLKKN